MTADNPATRKPCIALMGEFSAGKSTLANLLIGCDPLPVQVIATQLPPVWITFGNAPAHRTDLEGHQHPVDINDLAAVPLEDTAYIKIYVEEDILLSCDLLDMPGISDPNMSSDVWQRMISTADGVLWCSHATQAWRQSEAAVWASLPPELYPNSLLLLTRVDKLTTDRDRQKVVHRVRAETQGLFRACLPISLLQAASEQDDYDTWVKTGAGEFAKHFAELLQSLGRQNQSDGSGAETDAPAAPRMAAFEAPVPPPAPDVAAEPQVARIVPRRVLRSP